MINILSMAEKKVTELINSYRSSKQYDVYHVNIIGRNNGSVENIFSVSVNIYDLSAIYHALNGLKDRLFDYFIIEPVFFKDSLF